MNRNKMLGWICIIASIALIAGCSGAGETAQIDPPQTGENMLAPAEPASADAQQVFTSTVYVEDADGFVAPLGVQLPFDKPSVALTTLQYMVQGGPGEAMLPKGFRALLPAGTEIISLDIDETTRTATIDFNKAFTQYAKEDERKILESVVWAMTSFPSVDSVQLWVEGQWLKEMPVSRTPLHEPLTRSFGINVEVAQGAKYSRATPVTLYFMNQTADNFTYYVPVTRMITYTQDTAAAAVAELIKGPDSGKLDAVFMPGATATVNRDENRVWVDFDHSILAEGDKAPAEGLKAVVLSLADTVFSEGVQITVDGRIQVIGTDGVNYGAQPVTRPKVVNAYEM